MSEEIKNAAASPKKEKKPVKNIFKSKKFKHGGLSIVFTVIFIVAVVLVNVILSLVLDRFGVEADLTESGIYTMGEEMESYIRGDKSTVKLYLTSDKETLESAGSVFKQTMELAEKAADYNSGYSVEYVDLLTNPSFAAKYEGAKQGGLVIECTETGRYRNFNIGSDFLRYTMSDGNSYSYSEASMMSMYGYQPTAETSIAEQEMLSGIMSVTKVNPVKVAVATGFGEIENPDLTSLLEKNTYVIETVDMDMAESVSEDYDILIVNAPSMDYSIEALNKIDSWLSNGGKYGKSLMYFARVSDYSPTPNIDDFLADWGIEISEGYICQTDSDYAYLVPGYSFSAYYRAEIVKDTDYYAAMHLNPDSTFRANAVRPVKKLWEENSNFANTTIVQTYGENSVILPFGADETWTPETADERGQFGLLVEASKVRYEGSTPCYSRVIAGGSENLFAGSFLSATNYNNAETAVSVFNTISGNAGETITITPKSFTASTYEIEASKVKAIGLTFAVVIPVAIIITGIVVWVKRKRL